MTVLVENQGPVRTVVIARSAVKNAIDRATAEALSRAFVDFEGDEGAKVLVLTGEGGTFSAGADLKALSQGTPNRVEHGGDGPLGPTRMMLSKPSIAAIEGYAVAGGLELALLCDLRVCADDATFGVFCRRFGVPLIDGGTVRLPRLIGLSRALDLILTGRAVGADEALAIGLANRVVKKGEARAAAEALALQIASFPQACMRNDRRSAYEQHGLPLEAAIDNELRLGMASLGAGEAADGAMAFISGKGRHGTF